MFSQRKRFYQRKSFYGIVLACMLAFGFWVNQDPAELGQGEIKEPAVSTGEQLPTGQSGKNTDQDPDASGRRTYDGDRPYGFSNEYDANVSGLDDNPGADSENGEAKDSSGLAAGGPGFLVKEDGGYIKIYSVDEAGAKQLVRTTDISFSLLSESDQTLFKNGILKQSQDELSDLLQDFES